MPEFPNSLLSYPVRIVCLGKQIKTEFEGNYIRVLSANSKTKKRFELVWESLPHKEYEDLIKFFDEYYGKEFLWTNPANGQYYLVVFAEDTIRAEYREPGYWTVRVTLEEVW